MKSFTLDEVWKTVIPGDFKGTKIEYLIYMRNEKKIQEERNKGHCNHKNFKTFQTTTELVDNYL